MPKKVIGYTNPGGDESKIEKVYALTEAQARIMRKSQLLDARVKRLSSQMDAADDQLTALQGRCKHDVFNDDDGYPYRNRTCLLCGAGLGMV